jgi:predicted MFS family arabinose efflux permease
MSGVFSLQHHFLIGLAPNGDTKSASDNYYVVHNLGLFTACGFAYLFIKDYQNILLILDIITTLFAIGIIYAQIPKSKQVTPKQGVKVFEVIFKTPNAFKVLISILLFDIAAFSHFYILPLEYSSHHSLEFGKTTLMLMTNTFTVLFAFIFLKKLISSFSTKKVILIASSLMAGGMALALFAKSPLWIILTSIIWSLGEYLYFKNINTFLYKTFPEEHKGLASGLAVFCYGLSKAICPFLGYFLIGNTPLLILLFLLTPFLSMILLFYEKPILINKFLPIIARNLPRR